MFIPVFVFIDFPREMRSGNGVQGWNPWLGAQPPTPLMLQNFVFATLV